jgi:hypothetical protein
MTKINSIILLISFFCISCSKMISSTRSEYYEFNIDNGCIIEPSKIRQEDYPLKHRDTIQNAYTGVDISVSTSDNHMFKHTQLSKFRSLSVSKDPYSYGFMIKGEFDAIENFDGYFMHNGVNKIEIPIKTKDLYKVKDDDWHLIDYFEYDMDTIRVANLPITWNNTKSLYAVVKFTGVKNDHRTDYNLKCNFKKKLRIEKENDLWATLMGV